MSSESSSIAEYHGMYTGKKCAREGHFSGELDGGCKQDRVTGGQEGALLPSQVRILTTYF